MMVARDLRRIKNVEVVGSERGRGKGKPGMSVFRIDYENNDQFRDKLTSARDGRIVFG
jgi:hypothetical protein